MLSYVSYPAFSSLAEVNEQVEYKVLLSYTKISQHTSFIRHLCSTPSQHLLFVSCCRCPSTYIILITNHRLLLSVCITLLLDSAHDSFRQCHLVHSTSDSSHTSIIICFDSSLAPFVTLSPRLKSTCFTSPSTLGCLLSWGLRHRL